MKEENTMEIFGAENHHVKLGKTSVTVRGENGKTCGIVRNAWKLRDLQPNKQFDYLRKIKDVGFFGICINNDYMFDRVFVCNDELYYFNDLRPLEHYKKLVERVKPEDLARYYSADTEHYNTRLELVEKCKANGHITVINCYLD